jgi:hypothetical protein
MPNVRSSVSSRTFNIDPKESAVMTFILRRATEMEIIKAGGSCGVGGGTRSQKGGHTDPLIAGGFLRDVMRDMQQVSLRERRPLCGFTPKASPLESLHLRTSLHCTFMAYVCCVCAHGFECGPLTWLSYCSPLALCAWQAMAAGSVSPVTFNVSVPEFRVRSVPMSFGFCKFAEYKVRLAELTVCVW